MSENERQEVEKDEQERDKKENRIAWVRFAVLHILVLIPIVIGVTCFIVGNRTNNNTLSFAGMLAFEIGVPAVMLILVIAVLIWKFRGIRKAESDTAPSEELKEGTPPQREREQNAIDAVNSTDGFASRANLADYEVQHIAEGMKNAPKWGLPVGIGMFLLIVADVVVATVLAIKEIFVGTIICVALFAGFVITGLIVMSVSRSRAMNGDVSKAKKITEGVVKSCFMVGMAETRTARGHGETVRIQGVTYRVIVIADGEEYGTYAKQFYETGEKVTVAVMGRKRAKIVEGAEPEKAETE